MIWHKIKRDHFSPLDLVGERGWEKKTSVWRRHDNDIELCGCLESAPWIRVSSHQRLSGKGHSWSRRYTLMDGSGNGCVNCQKSLGYKLIRVQDSNQPFGTDSQALSANEYSSTKFVKVTDFWQMTVDRFLLTDLMTPFLHDTTLHWSSCVLTLTSLAHQYHWFTFKIILQQ